MNVKKKYQICVCSEYNGHPNALFAMERGDCEKRNHWNRIGEVWTPLEDLPYLSGKQRSPQGFEFRIGRTPTGKTYRVYELDHSAVEVTS